MKVCAALKSQHLTDCFDVNFKLANELTADLRYAPNRPGWAARSGKLFQTQQQANPEDRNKPIEPKSVKENPIAVEHECPVQKLFRPGAG